MATVQQLLDARLGDNAQLLGGESGLSGFASWVVTTRARTPALDPLKGGEVILLTSQALQYLGSVLSLSSLLINFKEGGAAAALVWDSPNKESVATANQIGLPLVLIGGMSPAEVERELLDHISTELRQGLTQQNSRQSKLLDALASNLGPDTILQVLAETIGLPAAFFPVSGSPIFSAGVTIELPSGFWSALPREQAVVSVSAGATGNVLWVTPVIRLGMAIGALVVRARTQSINPTDSTSMLQTATAIAVELGRLESLASAEQRLRQEFAQDLFSSTGLGTLQMRASSLGIDLPDHGSIVLIAPHKPGVMFRNEVQLRVVSTLRRYGNYPWLSATEQLVFFLPATLRGDNLASVLSRTAVSLSMGIAIGMSTPVENLGRLSEAMQEAQVALLASRNREPNSSVWFSEVGIYGLVSPLLSSPMVLKIVDNLLKPLQQHDLEHNSSMLSTLKVYLEENGNVTSAAQRLHLHRNSLAYRLHRIEDITSLNLTDSETRLLLSLALLLWDLR